MLEECLDAAAGDVLDVGARRVLRERAEDAEALVRISRGFDGGFLTFVLPLILDGVFHKRVPEGVHAQHHPDAAEGRLDLQPRRATQARRTRRAGGDPLDALAAVGWVAGLALKAGVGMRARAMAGAAARGKTKRGGTEFLERTAAAHEFRCGGRCSRNSPTPEHPRVRERPFCFCRADCNRRRRYETVRDRFAGKIRIRSEMYGRPDSRIQGSNFDFVRIALRRPSPIESGPQGDCARCVTVGGG